MDWDLLSALLLTLVRRLGEQSPELIHLAVADQEGLCLKLNQWREILVMFLRSVRTATKEKELLSDMNVKIWLDDVRELADDVEEILDEIANQALMAPRQTITGKKWFPGFISAYFTGLKKSSVVTAFYDSLSSKISDTSSRLEKLNTKRYALGLVIVGASLRGGTNGRMEWFRPLPTKTIYDRDNDKMKILEMLLMGEASSHANFSIIPIISVAEIDRARLARLVYDDKAVKDFKPRAWVSVSKDSDVLTVSKAILESVTSQSCNLEDLNEVLVELKEAIIGNKFLFVLDDVLTKSYGLWETLKSSFMAGAPGSKIIVTTCRVDIEFPIDLNIQPYTLEELSNEACWSLFKMHAFDREDSGVYKNLELIREKVLDMCKGLPLAARILGGLLRFKPRFEWEEVLNKEICDLAEDNEILPFLKLSYDYLSSSFKRCFAYCAILPKDYEFDKDELVFLWMAEGLIGGPLEYQQVEYQSWDDDQMEDRGSKVFQELLERSLFQHSSSHASKFRMHDLIKSMARWICGETDFRDDVLGVNNQPRRFRRACHSDTSASCDGKNKFELYYDVERLRTFLPGLIRGDDTHYITDVLLSDLLPKFKRLRALSLEKQHITQLPHSVEGSRYLRYVNLSDTMISRLPDSICSLHMLQILLLRDCSHLVELPSNLRNLINLRHLDITGFNLIREMPLGMKEMKCLRALLNFIVGKGVGSDLKDLESLKYLRELYISGLNNVTGSQDTKDSILVDRKSLKVLVLEWGSQLDDTRDELVEENVLAMLQPHQNLKELTIKGYGGTRFPSWVGDRKYLNIVVLTLERCEKCTVLPPLGCLSSLERLTIKGMTRIKRIGSEIFGTDDSIPLKSLKSLCFEDLQEWEHWDPVGENKWVHPFFCLCELSLVKCPKLCGKLLESVWLRKLTIQECGQLVVSFRSVPLSCEVTIDGGKMLCGSQSSLQENEGLWE